MQEYYGAYFLSCIHVSRCAFSNTAFFQHSGMILSDLDNIGTKEDGIEQLKNEGGGGEKERERNRREKWYLSLLVGRSGEMSLGSSSLWSRE